MPGQYVGGYVTGSARGACEVADTIEDKIEQNESKMTYKNYLIWLRSYELKSGGWVPRALVVIPSEEGNGEQDLNNPGASTVSTREDADTQAFTIAKQWIDERLEGRRQDRALPRSE
jgi:hypothetical protein